jgi:hypothetical protein
MKFFSQLFLSLFVLSSSAVLAAEHSLQRPRLRVLASYAQPLAHEGPVLLPERDELFFTSNRLRRTDGSQYVVVSAFQLTKGTTRNLGLTESIPMANGAFRLSNGNLVVTMQGDKTKPAGLA